MNCWIFRWTTSSPPLGSPGDQTSEPPAAVQDEEQPAPVEAETVPATLVDGGDEGKHPQNTVVTSPVDDEVGIKGEGAGEGHESSRMDDEDTKGLPTPRYGAFELETPLFTPTGLKARPTSRPQPKDALQLTGPSAKQPPAQNEVVPGSGKGGANKRSHYEDEFTTLTSPPEPLSQKAVYARIRRVFQRRADGTFQLDDKWNEAWADTKGDGRRELYAMFEKVGYNPDRVDESDESGKHVCIMYFLVWKWSDHSMFRFQVPVSPDHHSP